MSNIVLYGFAHLAGKTVSAFIGGLDAGDYTVAADGSVTVPFGADHDGLLTVAYLTALNATTWGEQAASIVITTATDQGTSTSTITVPVVIGLPFTSHGQLLRPASAEDLKSPTGPSLGKLRRGHQMAMLLVASGAFNYGTDFTKLQPAKLTLADRNTAIPDSTSFSGVYQEALPDVHGYDTQLAWEITRPVPFTVCAATTFLHGSEK